MVYLALVIIVIAAILYYFLSSPNTEDFSDLPSDLQEDTVAANLNIPLENLGKKTN